MNTTEFSVDLPSRLDAFLTEKTGKSRTFVQNQIKLSQVTVNGKICNKPGYRLQVADTVIFRWVEEQPLNHLTPTPGPLNLLYEDEYLLAVNKAAGVIVHPGAGRKENTLVHHLLHYLGEHAFGETTSLRPGIVHRLDEGTTGVLLIAKNDETQNLLSEMFKKRAIKKTYQAIAHGKMNLEGTFDSPVGRDRKDRKKMSSNTQSGRSALTRWKSLERFKHFTHVELYPHTGRTHQLRVHLSENQFPIVGDPTYGRKKVKTSLIPRPITESLNKITHTLLHASHLEFIHPKKGTPLEISAPLPADFNHFLQLLRELDPCSN